MLIIQGLVGPKLRTKVVGDGQQVYIPVPLIVCDGMTGTENLKLSQVRVQIVRWFE